jgi:hypothetical protein
VAADLYVFGNRVTGFWVRGGCDTLAREWLDGITAHRAHPMISLDNIIAEHR